jgi:hypothetical protein
MELRKVPTTPPPSHASLSAINYFNVLAFFLNNAANVPQAISFDWFSARDIHQYKSFLTPPTELTSLIIDVIVLFQGTFAVLQMMPSHRNSDLVQKGVGCIILGDGKCKEAQKVQRQMMHAYYR